MKRENFKELEEQALKEKLPYRVDVIYYNTNGTIDKQICSTRNTKRELHKEDIKGLICGIENQTKYLPRVSNL